MKKKVCGIYKITNNTNGKSYIGQSVDIFRRWKEHKNNIGKEGFDYILYHSLKKHGINKFSWEIVEECSKDFLDEREIYYIDLYNTYINTKNSNGYNMTLGGSGSKGVCSIPVSQYDFDGNLIATYLSITEASEATGVTDSGISSCCLHKRNHAGDYLWRYASDESPQPYEGRGTRVLQYDLQGKFLKRFVNARVASKEVGCFLQQITQCCKGTYKSAGGYQWKYEGSKKPDVYFYRESYYIQQFSKEGQFLNQYKTAVEASQKTGVSRVGIIHCYKGETKTSGGFIWRKTMI